MKAERRSDSSLLETVAARLRCDYLSDLRFPEKTGRARLVRVLEEIPWQAACLWEWNDALEDLLGGPPQETAEAARRKLIDGLRLLPRDR